MALDPFTAFTQFVTDHPQWHFVYEDNNLYLLAANPVNQGQLFDINPESPRTVPVHPGPYLHVYLFAVQNTTYDGINLTFRYRGNTYTCGGVTLTIGVSR